MALGTTIPAPRAFPQAAEEFRTSEREKLARQSHLHIKSSSPMTMMLIEVPVGAMVVVMPARPVVAGIIMPIHWSVIVLPAMGVAVIVVAVMVTIDCA
jgi:hypothetical protein